MPADEKNMYRADFLNLFRTDVEPSNPAPKKQRMTNDLKKMAGLLSQPNGMNIRQLMLFMDLNALECRNLVRQIADLGGDIEVMNEGGRRTPVFYLRDLTTPN